MPVRALALAALMTAGAAPGALAQSGSNADFPILVINQERLLAESVAGAEALQRFEEAARALSEENARIEAELTAEERALTDERATLPVEEFRARADDFDTRVQRIRAEQDQKARAIQLARDEASLEVIRRAGEVVRAISRERGALLVLEQRNVVLSADSIDITDELIARIDAGEGDGEP